MTRSISYGPSITMSMGANVLHDVADPAAAQDAATKNYVDTHVSGGGGSSSVAATPSLTLSTANSIGTSSSFIASNATVAVFNLLGPVAQAFGDTSLTGSAAFAARQDHRHPMPATPVTSIQKTGSSGITGSVTLSEGTNITLTQSGSDISIAAASQAGSGVTQISKTGSAAITGSVTLSQGTGITLTQSGHDISIAATELDYVERTSNLTVTATSEGTPDTVIDGNAVTYDGSTRVKIEFFATFFSATAALVVTVWDGSTDLGRICQTNLQGVPAYGARFLTPSGVASHTFHIKAWKTSGTSSLNGGTGGVGNYEPMFLRITKA